MVLLLYRHKGVMLFICTTVDFALLAKYELYNEDMIEYFKAILY
jgi:hypothetical protein